MTEAILSFAIALCVGGFAGYSFARGTKPKDKSVMRRRYIVVVPKEGVPYTLLVPDGKWYTAAAMMRGVRAEKEVIAIVPGDVDDGKLSVTCEQSVLRLADIFKG